MLYQKLLTRSTPYHIGISHSGTEFQIHRHPEIEFNYCQSGDGYSVVIDGTTYEMSAGKLAITTSMLSHEYKRTSQSDAVSITVMVGPVLLGEYYTQFSNAIFKCPVFDLNAPEFAPIRSICEEIMEIKSLDSDYSRLVERGAIYYLCANILKHIIEPFSEKGNSAVLLGVKKIEPALEYINHHYMQEVTVSEIATLCGYSESNFCKHFKKITGMSFHNALNKKRVASACAILKNTSLPLEEIASEVGFADAKSLCRVFKKELQVTPNKYRKDN